MGSLCSCCAEETLEEAALDYAKTLALKEGFA